MESPFRAGVKFHDFLPMLSIRTSLLKGNFKAIQQINDSTNQQFNIPSLFNHHTVFHYEIDA